MLARFNSIFSALGIFFVMQFLVRVILSCFAIFLSQISIYEAFLSLIVGFVSDLFPAMYLSGFLLVINFLFPNWLRRFLNTKKLTYLSRSFWITVLIFIAAGELLFWEEFGERFNFIAVDYLVYTHEVVKNIIESYPIFYILLAVFSLGLLLTWLMKKTIDKTANFFKNFSGLFFSLFLILFFIDAFQFKLFNFSSFFENRYARELSYNGIYQFFEAFHKNMIDYKTHYYVVADNEAIKNVRADLGIKPYNFSYDDGDPVFREIVTNSKNKKINVIVLMVESLSYDFLSMSYNGHELTPEINKLIPKSINFTNHYATGTRTVRGLEAFTLSVPPTPGSSIVRRYENENLYSLGYHLKENNYIAEFVYGGKGYFDNMNNFFSANGYIIKDQNDIKYDNMFTNAWGVADEFLFDFVLSEASEHHKNNQPFFMHVMTTSNHRPYTFPYHEEVMLKEGNREAAVRYTDFAIGKFIRDASKMPWFDNTIFIITADHTASSAGKSMINVNKYHIPWLIYAPKLINAKNINFRSSQIDMAPTILGLLNINFKSHFFGIDKIKNMKDSIITLGTYQNLGFYKGNNLVVLSPRRGVDCFLLDNNMNAKQQECDFSLVDEAASWYMVASDRFALGMMRRDLL